MSEAGRSGQFYLAGETVEQWQALSLRNLWTVEDTVQLLKTGQNRFATVSGSMTDVIHHSTQHFSDDDLLAIASYLKSLPAGKDDLPMPDSERPLAAPVDLYSSRGGLGYAQFCSDCHRKDGSGVPGMFPPLPS
ncbi:cytochrome C, partial [Escherichia coli]|nr:cytochrome C [Escherichia coli]